MFPRLISGALLALALGAAQACPSKVPAGLSAITVADSVTVNQLNMSILQVQGRENAASLLARIEKEWTDEGYAVKRNQAAGWEVVSALSEKCLTTLQLVERSGAFGYFARNPLNTKVAKLPKLPMPPGGKVLSTVASNDDGRQAVTVMISSTQSVNALATYYKKRLTDEQWGGVRAAATMGRDGKFVGAAVSGQRGREQIEVVIVRDEGSKVVINLASAL